MELAELFAACRQVFVQIGDDTHWHPVPGSIAAADAVALPSPDPRVGSTGSPSGFALISDVVLTYLQVATGHLGGLAALYASGEVFFPPALLVRAVLENCAHAMWVLGDAAVDGSPEGRLRRAYLEDVLSAEEAKKVAGRLGLKSAPTHLEAKADFKRVQAEIQAVFPSTSGDIAARRLSGQEMLSPQACVTWMYELLERNAASSVDARQAEGVYDFLSNNTHPTLYPARQLRERVDHGDHVGSILRLDIDFLERLSSAAVLAFYNALSYVMSYHDLPRDRHHVLTETIDRILPTALT